MREVVGEHDIHCEPKSRKLKLLRKLIFPTSSLPSVVKSIRSATRCFISYLFFSLAKSCFVLFFEAFVLVQNGKRKTGKKIGICNLKFVGLKISLQFFQGVGCSNLEEVAYTCSHHKAFENDLLFTCCI